MNFKTEGSLYPFDIVVASPNTALDSYYLLSELTVGAVNRANMVYHTAGGKANNLARAARALGGRVLSLGITGGFTGQFIVSELAREGIPCDMTWVNQEARRSSTLISPGQSQTTVVLDTGSAVTSEDGDRLRKKIWEHAPKAPFLVLTGSLPPGLASNFYANVIHDVASIPGLKVCVDCGGAVLQSAVEAGSQLVKVNISEYMASFAPDQPFSLEGAQRTFQKLQSRGVELMIVTDGPNGAYVYSDQCPPFQVKTNAESPISTAGAGDTFTAGLLMATSRGRNLQQATTYASAAAAAALKQVVCGHLDPQDVETNLARTEIYPISRL